MYFTLKDYSTFARKLIRSVFILCMILESIREDKAQKTRERRERARKSPVA